jgi:hypothetical protein
MFFSRLYGKYTGGGDGGQSKNRFKWFTDILLGEG